MRNFELSERLVINCTATYTKNCESNDKFDISLFDEDSVKYFMRGARGIFGVESVRLEFIDDSICGNVSEFSEPRPPEDERCSPPD
ncbi:hypothetical protein KIN20_002981 [Parelaphostrongylus tenuis]|uniref:Uncharacterized protein n=1 Tax=Parelaphostrongylus tenuis TaxID=148309 RepID=A0AAD5QH43_PARTN|nr:hypothetical protein KIN20_002981 [Parelaphostrongylus tenuis]